MARSSKSLEGQYRSYKDDYKHLAQYSFWKLELASCFSGDGKNEPMGILNYNDSVLTKEITVIEARASGKVDFDDLIRFKYSLDKPYLDNAVFVMSRHSLTVLEAITDKSGNKVYKNNKLLDVPVYTSEHVEILMRDNIGIIFGDFKNYVRITDIGDAIAEYRYPNQKDPGGDFITFTKRMGGGVVEADAFKFFKMKK